MIRNRRIVGLMVVALLVIAVRMVNAPVSYSQGGRLARCGVGHPARACRPLMRGRLYSRRDELERE